MNEADKKWLADHVSGDVLFDEPMRRYTTFRIGGPADALITVQTEQELKDTIVWARDKGYPIIILGAGSNLLVRDGGIRGLVLKLAGEFEEIHLVTRANSSRTMITAGAAVLVRLLGKFALDQGLAGLNFTLGIPGSLGGAIRMNAGAWGGCMADYVSSIRVLNLNGDIVDMNRDQLQFSYRGLDLEKGTIILSSRFELKYTDRDALQKEAIRMQKERRLTQPLSLPSAGSVFRNPSGDKAAGELIDQAGLKGLQVGGAEVSTKHANFIVNKGHAKASDVLELIRQIQEAVFKRYSVNLEPEVIVIGQEKGS